MRVQTVSAASLWLLLALSGSAVAVPPPLPAEHLEVAKLPPMNPHWVFIVDEALYNEVDARIFVYDGDHHRHLGQIDAGYYPGFAMSPDRKTTAVATTYWSRGWHGTRTDVVEFTDNATLGFQNEVVLPPKRMTGPPTPFNVGYSPDQRFLYSSNLTPAASFTVVDVTKHEVASEVETDGCVLVIPSGPRQVSSLCESGRLLTVTLGEDGHETARSLSAPFFNADRDPIFVQGIVSGHDVMFLSFLGDVYTVSFSAGAPHFAPTWPLVTAAERGKWRPGGNQMGSFHRALARLYVPMHPGVEGSHKQGGTEIWVYDTDSHKRIARWPVDQKRFGAVLTMQVTSDAEPLLFATTDNASLLIFDARTGQLKHSESKVGQTSWYLWTP